MPANSRLSEGPLTLRFPSIEEVIAINRFVIAEDGLSQQDLEDIKLVELDNVLDHCKSIGSLIKATAALAHGIAGCQSFYEGNKRTAFIVAQKFWHDNADQPKKQLFSGDDLEFAKLLQEAAVGRNVIDDMTELLNKRLDRSRRDI